MKKLSVIGCIVCMLLFMVGCSSTTKDPSYDEDVVLSKTKEVIEKVNLEDYEGALSNCVKELESFSPEELKKAVDDLGEKGAFVSFDEHEMVVQKGYAAMGIVVSYENMRIQYTVSFDEDLKLAGFYLKQV